MRRISIVLSFGLVLLGCPQFATQRPAHVAVAPPPDAATRISTMLASEGFAPDAASSKDSIVVTEWRDTGYGWGMVDNTRATIVRRFMVAIGPADTTLRADVKRCPVGGFTIAGQEVRGRCETLEEIPEKFQKEVDSLGAKVQGAYAK